MTASVGVARAATKSFSISMRTRSRDSVSRPARARMQACNAGRIRRALAEMRVKAEKAQDAQIVLFDPPLRLADEAHAARGNVANAADIVVHRSVGRGGQRIDGEIAPLGVRPPIAAEHDARLAAECFDVLAQRRDLERMVIDDGGDGAMLDAGRNRLAAGRRDAPHDLLRHRRRRHVDFVDRKPQQRIAHRAADHARFFAVAIEQREQARDLAVLEPGGVAEMRSWRHRVVPGTNLPPSICAGT